VATLLVCTTCRRDGIVAALEGRCPGQMMLSALEAAELPSGLRLQPVQCLSACSQGCAVALSSPGKWTYVYGRLDPAEHVPAIIDGAAKYAASFDGIVPWRERPEIFRKNSLARVPPLENP
jgi:predicted metal-binding protein